MAELSVQSVASIGYIQHVGYHVLLFLNVCNSSNRSIGACSCAGFEPLLGEVAELVHVFIHLQLYLKRPVSDLKPYVGINHVKLKREAGSSGVELCLVIL